MGVTVQVVVKNEEQWIWYALSSVRSIANHYNIYDTGSNDHTISIIKHFLSTLKKPVTAELRQSDDPITKIRNDQLSQTKTDWFLLLDGDEVWSDAGCLEIQRTLKNASPQLSAAISPVLIPLGDLFHYQDSKAGKYEILGKKGHFNIRLYRKRKRYSWSGVYPLEAYCDESYIPVQKNVRELIFLKTPYWHLTHLARSSRDIHEKRKLEKGKRLNVLLPKIFFMTRPEIITSPWQTYNPSEYYRAQLATPLRKLKRRIWSK